MKEINYETWERRPVYDLYADSTNPFYMVTFRMDVTGLYNYTKARGLSFYMGMIWVCTEAVNRVKAFRIALKDGKLVEIDRRDPSFTDLRPGEECYHIVTMEHMEDMDAFCQEAARISREQETFIDLSKESDDLIYITCLPWVELTAMTNERDLTLPGAAEDSIPRISWGKYTEENGRKKIGISMEVNHRFIDGLHIGRFAWEMEKLTAGLGL